MRVGVAVAALGALAVAAAVLYTTSQFDLTIGEPRIVPGSGIDLTIGEPRIVTEGGMDLTIGEPRIVADSGIDFTIGEPRILDDPSEGPTRGPRRATVDLTVIERGPGVDHTVAFSATTTDLTNIERVSGGGIDLDYPTRVFRGTAEGEYREKSQFISNTSSGSCTVSLEGFLTVRFEVQSDIREVLVEGDGSGLVRAATGPSECDSAYSGVGDGSVTCVFLDVDLTSPGVYEADGTYRYADDDDQRDWICRLTLGPAESSEFIPPRVPAAPTPASTNPPASKDPPSPPMSVEEELELLEGLEVQQ